MRIGIYTPYLDGLTGGEKYMLTIASCLSKKHEVIVFWDDKTILDKGSKKFSLDLSRVQTVPNIFSSKISLSRRLLESRKYNATIVLSDGSIPLTLSPKQFIHFQFPVEWVKVSMKTKIKMARITNFFCNSQFTKSYIDKKFGVNSVVLYPPVDMKEKRIKKQNVILNVGRFGRTVEGNNYKKQDFLIDTFKKMCNSGLENWEFILVVSLRKEDELRFKSLEEQAEKYPIRFIINPSNDDLWKIYSQAKIYWHASGYGEDLIKHPEYAEHFGISTVEAMGAGAVPVVINAGGQKEIVVDGKNGFLWDTQDEVIKKTLDVIKSDDIYIKLSRNGRKEAQKFSLERFCEEVVAIIEK